jgi:NTP pyrophosphatase (non-canonical NTP hydrolase)
MGSANDYQKWTETTAIYKDSAHIESECPNCGTKFIDLGVSKTLRKIYVLLGLAGEVGEIFEKVKKTIRGGKSLDQLEGDSGLKKEFGDARYYLARGEDEFGFESDDVQNTNRWKLEDRKDRGVLHGDGDNR